MFRISLFSLFLTTLGASAEPGPVPREIRTDLYGDRLPDGAIARLGTVRWRLDGAVMSLAFGPDDKTIFSCTNQELVEWDRETGRALRRVSAGEEMSSLVLSADQRTLIGTGKTLIRRWNVSDGRELPVIEDKEKQYVAATLSPDGSLVAAFDKREKKIHVLDGATGKRLHQFPYENAFGTLLVFTPDGRRLAFTGLNGRINMFDLATGRADRWFGSGHIPRAVAFSPDGKTVAVGRLDWAFCLWDAETGKLRLEHTEGSGFGVAFSPDGKTVAQAGMGSVRLWDTATGRDLKHLSTPGHLLAVAFSRDGRTLAVGGIGRTIRLLDVATGKVLNPAAGHEGPVVGIAFSPDGRTLASAGLDDTVRMWDAKTTRELFQVLDHKYGASQLFFTPDGRSLVSAGGDGAIRWSDVAAARETPQRFIATADRGIIHTPDFEVLAGIQDRQIMLWDGINGKPLGRLGSHPSGIERLAFAAGGRTLVSVGVGESAVHLWDMQTRAPWRRFEYANRSIWREKPLLTAVTPDGRMLATHMPGGLVLLREIASGNERQTIQSELADIAGMAVTPDGRMLAVAESRGLIEFHDLVEGRKLATLSVGLLTPETGPAMAFSPDGRLLALARSDTTIMLWAVPVPPRLEGKLSSRPDDVWADLASANAGTAYKTIRMLTASPAEAAAILNKRLRPVPSPDRMAVSRWVTDLDNDRFAIRERAGAELAKLRQLTVPALKAGLNNKLGEEGRGRIEKLLARAEVGRLDPAGDELREIRSVEVLEATGTPEAKRVLEVLAKGAPEARLTEEAKEALGRLSRMAELRQKSN
ncbi:WD40 repeat domain-containing protein [Zavarzinella formosa]|uniref:WD40 repeat domain-containing protein n=1 Tax=Zavarzinella formosa TaxID=360055 RepID=UPI0003116C84|nr:WD40 repeat domain-containing protein [Zavarzinella formosa]